MGVVFGRSSELALVEDSLGAGEPCALVGESGIGKTTLARAVAARFGPSLVGGGLSTLSWVPYVPLWLALGQKLPSGDDAHVADEVARRVGDGLLVVDDLQWADGGTRRVVELLAGRVRLLTAVRSDEAEAAEAVAVCERAGMRIVRLEPLDADASLALIETLRDDLPRARALRLVERARGNPLFLQELAETGAPSRSFRLALAARIRRLTPAAQEALGLLALLGRPAPAGTLPEPAAAELLERGFVEQAGGTLAIRHPLFAEAAAADLGEDLRRRLHARLAELVDDQGEAAHHLAAAGMAERAGELALAAAAQAPSQAERAALLALAASSADGERGVELSLQAARELARCGEHAAAERLLDGLPPLEGHRLAEAACIRWGTRWELGDLEGAKAEVRRGLAAAGSAADLVTELRLAEVSLTLLDERTEPAERLRKAAAGWRLARRHGVRVARAAYLHGTALYLARRPEWVKQLERAVEEGRLAGDSESELTAGYNAIGAHESYCRLDRARDLAVRMLDRASELRLGSWERQFRTTIVNLDLHLGRYEAVVEEGLRLLDEGLDPRRRDIVEIDVALALVDLGRFEQAAPRIDRLLAVAASDVRGQGLGTWLRAEAELWSGRARAALETIDSFLALEDVGVFEPFGRVVEAWARLELGMPVAPWTADGLPPILAGVPPELDGVSALAEGRPGEAAGLLARAADAYAGAHLRGELRCRLGVGMALRSAGELEQARETLLAVEAEAGERGMAPLVARAQRSLRLAGVRRAAPRARRADGLTVREAEVLELAASGLTNAAIARRLGVGPSTVKRLVSSGARKLGAVTRAQAVAQFAEL